MYYEIKNGAEKHGHLISEKEIKGIFANVIGGGRHLTTYTKIY